MPRQQNLPRSGEAFRFMLGRKSYGKIVLKCNVARRGFQQNLVGVAKSPLLRRVRIRTLRYPQPSAL